MIVVELKGQLIWYVGKKNRIFFNDYQGSINNLLEQLHIPLHEVGNMTLNNKRTSLSDIISDGDVLVVFPVG